MHCSISTVGYGDYSPSTVLSRIFIVFATFSGVTFFSYMSVRFLEILASEASGRGKFIAQKRRDHSGRGHILVMGGGVSCGSATVLETFLRALCRDGCPEIVLLSESECSPQVRAMMKREWTEGYSLNFYVGSPLEANDLVRVQVEKSSMVFIIADFQTGNTVVEDRGNMLMASALTRMFPDSQYRLMLVGLPALELSSQIGLSEYNCFSIESLKAGLMASSLRNPGFATIMLNLGLPDLPNPQNPYETGLRPDEVCGEWIYEYSKGCSREPCGFLPHARLVGLTFRAATAIAGKENILLIAAQVDGAIRINPSAVKLTPRTILFAIAQSQVHCDCIAKNGNADVSTWISQFQLNRKLGGFGKRQKAKFVRRHRPAVIEAVYQEAIFEAEDFDSSGGVALRQPTFDDATPSKSPPQKPGAAGVDKKAGDSRLFLPALGGLQHDFKGGIESSVYEGLVAASSRAKLKVNDNRIENDLKQGVDIAGRSSSSRRDAAVKNVEKLRKAALKGGHIVAILLEDSDGMDQQTLWKQLEVIVSCIRWAGEERPLVVVHSRLATPSRQRFLATSQGSLSKPDSVFFCVGDPLHPKVKRHSFSR